MRCIAISPDPPNLNVGALLFMSAPVCGKKDAFCAAILGNDANFEIGGSGGARQGKFDTLPKRLFFRRHRSQDQACCACSMVPTLLSGDTQYDLALVFAYVLQCFANILVLYLHRGLFSQWFKLRSLPEPSKADRARQGFPSMAPHLTPS